MQPVENALREQDYLAGWQQSFHEVTHLHILMHQGSSKEACIKTTN